MARFVIPFGREGAADRATRAFVAAMKPASSGWHLENVPGAGGLLGVHRANGLVAAGETTLLLATPTTHALLPQRLGAAATPSPELQPLSGLGSAPNVLLVSPRLGVTSVAGLVERAKRDRLVYASAGVGQTIHVCSELFCRLAGVQMDHRPFDTGSAEAYGDFIAGSVHVYFDNLLGCRERIASGEAIPLAVSAARRSPSLPDVPTLVESGMPGHALDVWLGVFAAHASDDIHEAATNAVSNPRFREELQALGLHGGPLAADDLCVVVRDSSEAWRAAALA